MRYRCATAPQRVEIATLVLSRDSHFPIFLVYMQIDRESSFPRTESRWLASKVGRGRGFQKNTGSTHARHGDDGGSGLANHQSLSSCPTDQDSRPAEIRTTSTTRWPSTPSRSSSTTRPTQLIDGRSDRHFLGNFRKFDFLGISLWICMKGNVGHFMGQFSGT